MTQAMTAPAPAAQQVSRVDRIENAIDRPVANNIAVSSALGGMQFNAMVEVMEFAKLMAVSDVAVPKHLRGNPGACMAVCIQAIEWRMSPYAVANKSYVVNDRISYESQLIHAVVEQRAPIVNRLRNRYVGEGDKRQCIVWATGKGETEPFEYTSAEFGKIQPKNSPLWKTKPDLQLFYNASRDWARMYFPDVILGVYAEDEIEVDPAPAPIADGTRAFGFTKQPEKAPQAQVTRPVSPVVAQAPPKANQTGIFNQQQDQPVAATTAAAEQPVQEQVDPRINPETGEFIEETPPAAQDSDDIIGARDEESEAPEGASPPPPPPPPAAAKDELPPDATWDWMVAYAIKKAPPAYKLTEIEVKSQVNLGSKKPWPRLNRSEQEAAFAKVRDGQFPWRPGKAAQATG